MNITLILLILGLFGISAYYAGLKKSLVLREAGPLHSTPIYHGAILAVNSSIASVLFIIIWILLEKNIFPNLSSARIILFVISILIFILTAIFTFKKIKNKFKARDNLEKIIELFLLACSTLAILITIGILLSVIFESNRFFSSIPIAEFLFGTHWSPQMPIREDQAGSAGAFGAVPLFTGTFLIAFIAMCIAGPIGLMSAIYLSEYASKKVRDIVKPLTEILAGIPTVVYGFFAVIVVAPFIRNAGEYFGLEIASESALAAGLVMGVMIIPFVSSISDDVINAVPQNLKNGSLGIGATKSETIKKVIVPAALPGIIGGLLLAVSRAIGETMIVVMAAGMSANLTANPFEAVTTVTVQIVVLLVGDQEFDSPKTLAAFALGLILFIMTLILNYIALHIVRKYREQYE
ncbi:MAG: phosphate ABC transporter permease subunit PstC [Gammaproteobacteria bacterium]|nr:phosphate ABC transporter permease subunit PstC [Gammaproteobacteria bacterium]